MDQATGVPAWLESLPSGAGFYWVACTLLVTLVAVRELLARTAAGRRSIDVLHFVESLVISAMLLAMLLLSFLQIVLRNVAGTGLLWIDPLLRHLFLWIGFAGAAFASRLDRHMKIEALARVLPGHVRRAARLVTLFATAGVCLVLAGACLQALREEAAAGTSSFLDLPTWVVQSIMPAGFFLMAYRFLRRSLEREAPGAELELFP